MQCENGYIKDGVRGILCREAEEPISGDLGSVAHALCGHQRFCANERCYTFLPSWEACTKRKKNADCHANAAVPAHDDAQKPTEAAGEEIVSGTNKSTPKKKRAQSAK